MDCKLHSKQKAGFDLVFVRAIQGTPEDTYMVARGGGISLFKVLIGLFRPLGRNVEKMGAAPVKGRRHPSPAPQWRHKGQTVFLRGIPGSGAGDWGWRSNPEMPRSQASQKSIPIVF